jgi:hypothetical protein
MNESINLIEYHLKSVGQDPTDSQVFKDFTEIAIKVTEEGLLKDGLCSGLQLRLSRHTSTSRKSPSESKKGN